MACVLRDTELFNLPLDFPQRFPADIRAVTADQVQAAAKKYIHPDRLVQIVVTPRPSRKAGNQLQPPWTPSARAGYPERRGRNLLL